MRRRSISSRVQSSGLQSSLFKSTTFVTSVEYPNTASMSKLNMPGARERASTVAPKMFRVKIEHEGFMRKRTPLTN